MKKTRFASLLLTGKVASLPLLIGQARADVTPTGAQMSPNNALQVIELPVDGFLRLQSITADAGGAYGGSYGSAYFCTNSPLPIAQAIVVTGVQAGKEVILAAASNKNDPFHLAIDSRLTLGTQGLKILGSAKLDSGSIAPAADAGTGTTGRSAYGTIAFNVTTTSLTALAVGGKFYIQAAVIPSAGSPVSSWQFSELDEIRVASCVGLPY